MKNQSYFIDILKKRLNKENITRLKKNKVYED